MKHPFLTTFAISASACTLVFSLLAAGNRSMERRLAGYRSLEQQPLDDQSVLQVPPGERIEASEAVDANPREATPPEFELAVADIEQIAADRRDANPSDEDPRWLHRTLKAVQGLSASQMIDIAKQMSSAPDVRDYLLMIASRQDTEAVLANRELLSDDAELSVLVALGRKDPLAVLRRFPYRELVESREEPEWLPGVSKLRNYLAVLAMGVDLDAGLKAFLESPVENPTILGKTYEMGGGMMGNEFLPDGHIPGLVAAIDDPQFEPIRGDLVRMTLDKCLREGGVAAAAAQAESMPLTPDELKGYLESLQEGYGIMQLEPVPTMEWAASALPLSEQLEVAPKLFLQWVGAEPEAARDWLEDQPPSPVRDETIANFATTAPSLDHESAALWAIQIQDGGMRSRTVRQVVEEWRQEDPSAAALWLEQNEIE